ncbi:MAG: hypothetical protein QNJ74_07180, partial [Trichodesmium sp. MO_231.B1]|nr:hypothetical protein [Trichodesmium sp. MO_231.B1]
DRKEARALEAGALLAQLLCKRQQKAQIARWLGIPRCTCVTASGGCQYYPDIILVSLVGCVSEA